MIRDLSDALTRMSVSVPKHDSIVVATSHNVRIVDNCNTPQLAFKVSLRQDSLLRLLCECVLKLTDRSVLEAHK